MIKDILFFGSHELWGKKSTDTDWTTSLSCRCSQYRTFLWKHQLESLLMETAWLTLPPWQPESIFVKDMATYLLSDTGHRVKDSWSQMYRLPPHARLMIPAKVDLGVLQWGRLHCTMSRPCLRLADWPLITSQNYR